MSTTRVRTAKIAWSLAIVLVSATAGLLVDWQAPGVGRYTRDWLMRGRGTLPVPDDIAIVAIDENSMSRFGRFPWSRQVIARTVDTLAAAHPKVIALDVLFTDPSTPEDDDALARSIGRAGNVVLAAELTDSPIHGGPSRWLEPLPALERAAAAVGHVNVQTESDGVARQVAVRLADDTGRSYRAMPVETVRIAAGTPEEHGALMPGVEVLANAVHVILGSRYYTETGDLAGFLCGALSALLTLLLLEAAQGGSEFLKQLAVLLGMAAFILLAGYLAFIKLLIYPPLVVCLVAFGCAGPLALLRRSLVASARLDSNIAQLALSGDLLAPAGGIPGPYHWASGGPVSLSRGWLPKGLEWKAWFLSDLNARLLDRAKFVNFALRSVEDGLLIAENDGRITFANRSAGAILGVPARGLVGQNLIQRLPGSLDGETLARLMAERSHLEREVTVRGLRTMHYMLRLAAVSADEKGDGPVLGIVASLSDITRQHELQQTKNDVISLVPPEMRTPLTAIQGMTELLAAYDVETGRRREMNLAINDEVKRLARMISSYLDITRLESGATAMRLSPVRAEAILERILILVEPVAAQRRIKLERNFPPALPPFLADADLLARAIENLISNAVKYSPEDTVVTISARAEEDYVAIEVADQGYGIPEADLTRVFEKFYRVPRVQDAGTPGTGLGLALVREIAELHNGSVSVKSEVNQGSTFTLRIPCKEAQ